MSVATTPQIPNLRGTFVRRQTIPLGQIKLVRDYYPRDDVMESHVNHLVRALEHGETLPPLIVDENDDWALVDGLHRYRAYLKHYGLGYATVLVDVDVYHYASPVDVAMDAFTWNAYHGLPLDARDRARVVNILYGLKVPVNTISVHLRMSQGTVTHLVDAVYHTSPLTAPVLLDAVLTRTPIATPLKTGLQQTLSGRTLTQDEALAHQRAPAHYSLPVSQLLEALHYGWFNTQDTKLMGKMCQLSHRLRAWLLDNNICDNLPDEDAPQDDLPADIED